METCMQHTQLAAGSRVEGTPGANALTKGTRPQQHDGEAEENRYILKKGGIRADGEQKVKKQLCLFLYEVMTV